MAIKEVKYVCEFCRKKFIKETEANNCEKEHYEPIEMTKVYYDFTKQSSRYPDTINVKLKNKNGNEKTITYKRS